MRFSNLSDRIVHHVFLDNPSLLIRLRLITHLRRHPGFAGCEREFSGFPHGMRQWLFAVHMFSVSNGGHRRMKVMMIRCAYDDRVNLRIHFLQHDAIVFELLGFRKLIEHPRSTIMIDIAQGHNVLRCHGLNITGGLTTCSDRCDIQSLIGCVRARRSSFQNCERRRCGSCRSQKTASVSSVLQHGITSANGENRRFLFNYRDESPPAGQLLGNAKTPRLGSFSSCHFRFEFRIHHQLA